MAITGPLPSLPTLEEVEEEASTGGLDIGQLVYVESIADFVVIWRTGPFPVYTRTRYPDIITFESETEEQPIWTPGVIVTGELIETVLVDSCSGTRTLSELDPNIDIASFNLNGTDPKRPAPREEGSGIDVDFDASDLPDIASVGDPP
jgi:hypothetical protein